MEKLKKSIYLLLTFLFLIPSTGFSQNSISNNSLDSKIMNAAREIMTSAETCALITVDEDGRPRVREMSPFLPENDFTVWFGTNPKSRKVQQIKKNSVVTLYYTDLTIKCRIPSFHSVYSFIVASAFTNKLLSSRNAAFINQIGIT